VFLFFVFLVFLFTCFLEFYLFVFLHTNKTVPVKADHVKLLQSALIPLHKVKSMQMYHAHLVYCMAQYIEKEQRFAIPIIGGILKYYPYGNTGKELLFLEELCELIEVLSPATLAEVEVPVYQRLALCIEGDHFQIAEKALHFWGNEILNQTVMEMQSHRAVVLPLVFNALYKNSNPETAHWQGSIRDGAMFVLQRYESTDPDLYQQCVAKYELEKPYQSSKK
jgi:serine/threonine-protein phosphatase 2A regulatory subunit B'